MGKTIKEIKIGDTAEFTKTISETDVYLYAGITGDLNPAHVNEVEAGKGNFKTRIAHGMLTAGLVSAVLGMKLPGPGTAKVEAVEIIKDKILKLKTTCTNQKGEIVLDGVATVMPPRD